jgi:hypothetical protein
MNKLNTERKEFLLNTVNAKSLSFYSCEISAAREKLESYNGFCYELERDLKRAYKKECFLLENGNIIFTLELVFKGQYGSNRFMKIYEISKENNYAYDLSFLLNDSKFIKYNNIGLTGSTQWNCGGFSNNIHLLDNGCSDIIQSIKAAIE